MLDQVVLEKVCGLSADRQEEVLDFIEFLGSKVTAEPKRKRRNIVGLLSDIKTDISFEEIKELCHEMWKSSPQDPEL